jgi:transcriptional regulator with XRE-family HTH domain
MLQSMKPQELRAARLNRGWTQTETARRLGVTQPYVVMLEKGKRPLTAKLTRRLRSAYRLSAAFLPLPQMPDVAPADPQRLAHDFAALGYPGYAYLRTRAAQKNPGAVLLTAVSQANLEPRLLEALPWLLLHYWDTDFSWLVEQAKRFDLQNRFGFVASQARRLSEVDPEHEDRTRALSRLESTLERSRLAREDEFPGSAQTDPERRWLEQNRSDEARHWNLLTDLRPDHLGYDAHSL